MAERLLCKPAFFTPSRPEGPVRRLLDNGLPFAYFDRDILIISHNRDYTEICKRDEIKFPCTEGLPGTDAVIAAALTMFLSGEKKETIKNVLCHIV
jgi:hypothetical protein